jgi:Cu2+-containing amine oxidase
LAKWRALIDRISDNSRPTQEEGHRLLRVECYDGSSSPNYWGRPIELVATVDLNRSRILELIDTVVAVPKEPAEYDPKSKNSSRASLNPVIV